jgi:hypothetical protein
MLKFNDMPYPEPKATAREETLKARGAKRGGLTDHLSGVHLIPNVGREAMVPGEVVCRRRTQPKAKPKPEAKPKPIIEKPKKRHRSPPNQRVQSRAPPKERARSSSSSSEPERTRQVVEDLPTRRQEELERRRKEEEARRFEDEQKKLKELELLRQKQQDMQSARKQRLGGLFALTEDDIEAEEDDGAKRARIAREKARIEKKAVQRPEPQKAPYASPEAAVASAPRSSAYASTDVVDSGTAGSLTAADLDGSLHDHKFSKVWKDWDAAKKSDPGEIARQFMKIAAIKRRGYAQGKGSGEARSRSRSRGRGRR